MTVYIIFHILCIGFVVGVIMEETHIKPNQQISFVEWIYMILFAPFLASTFIGAFICHLGNKE